MKPELFGKILNELTVDFNPEELTVALSYGGESLLHPKFREYTEQVSKCGFKTLHLYTNGILLNKANRKTLIDAQVAVYITLHNSPLLPKVIENAEVFAKEMVKALGRVQVGLSISLEEFLKADIHAIVNKMKGPYSKITAGSGIMENLHVVSRMPNLSKGCKSQPHYLGILWDGETLPCCHLLSPGTFTLGNVTQNSIKEVFYGQKYEDLRQNKIRGFPCDWCEVRY